MMYEEREEKDLIYTDQSSLTGLGESKGRGTTVPTKRDPWQSSKKSRNPCKPTPFPLNFTHSSLTQ